MSNAPLMPKGAAIWLVENTSLSFDQIASFCKLYPLGEGTPTARFRSRHRGYADPITSASSREEIARGGSDRKPPA